MFHLLWNIYTKWLPWWPDGPDRLARPGGATCISKKFDHQVAPLALLGNLSTRWEEEAQLESVYNRLEDEALEADRVADMAEEEARRLEQELGREIWERGCRAYWHYLEDLLKLV